MTTIWVSIFAILGLCASGMLRAEVVAPQAIQEVLERQREMEAEIRELRGALEALQFKMSRSVQASPQPISKKVDLGAPLDPYDQAVHDSQARLDGTKTLSAPTNASRDEKMELYNKARQHIMKHEYEEARSMLQRVLALDPAMDVVIDANFWIGETFFIRGNYSDAVKAYAKSYQAFKEAHASKAFDAKLTKAPNSLLQLVRSLLKVGQPEKAQISMNEFRSTFSDLPNRTLKTQLSRTERELLSYKA